MDIISVKKQNFLKWYGHYATLEDLGKFVINRDVLNKVLREYANEIDMINCYFSGCNTLRCFQPHGVQGYDMTLEIS